MKSNLKPSIDLKEVRLAYDTAVYGINEYRTWKNNAFIGSYLGHARIAYLSILRRRALDAIEAYRLLQSTSKL